MAHGPVTHWKEDKASPIKTHLGVGMFLFYTFLYALFIFINVTDPKFMGVDVGSFNVAITFGFGLINIALILAFIYSGVCGKAEELLNNNDSDSDGGYSS